MRLITAPIFILLATQAVIALNNARLYTQVQSTQNRLNKFLNAIPLGISVHDAKGQLVYANQVSQQLLKIQDLVKAEAEQLSQAYRIYRADTNQMYPVEQLPVVRSLGGEKTRADDLELHSSQGIVPLEVTSTPIFDETGNIEYAIAAFQDISDRKQAQKTLIENVRLEQEISERKKVSLRLLPIIELTPHPKEAIAYLSSKPSDQRAIAFNNRQLKIIYSFT